MTNNICPFQVVEEWSNNEKLNRKWIVLARNINHIRKKYTAIQPFHQDWIEREIDFIKKYGLTSRFREGWLHALFYGKREAAISPIYDVIRNPTFEEIKFIQQILKINQYKFNRKTKQLIKINNDKC